MATNPCGIDLDPIPANHQPPSLSSQKDVVDRRGTFVFAIQLRSENAERADGLHGTLGTMLDDAILTTFVTRPESSPVFAWLCSSLEHPMKSGNPAPVR